MAETMSISGPVRVETEDTSPAAVAFDLMKFLGDTSYKKGDRDTREYWLTLYRQCYKATIGNSLESILRED